MTSCVPDAARPHDERAQRIGADDEVREVAGATRDRRASRCARRRQRRGDAWTWAMRWGQAGGGSVVGPPDRAPLARERTQHPLDAARIVAGARDQPDRELVGLDLVVALVVQVRASVVAAGARRVDERPWACAGDDVADLVREQPGELGLVAQERDRAAIEVDHVAGVRVGLRRGSSSTRNVHRPRSPVARRTRGADRVDVVRRARDRGTREASVAIRIRSLIQPDAALSTARRDRRTCAGICSPKARARACTQPALRTSASARTRWRPMATSSRRPQLRSIRACSRSHVRRGA